MKTLIVDGHPEIRSLLAEVVATRGHGVVVCGDGRAGLELARREFFGLIVCDWELPDMHSREFCRLVRRLPHGGRSVLLVTTGEYGAEAVEDLLGAGADDYIPKPWSLHVLHLRLRIAEKRGADILERRRTEEALEFRLRFEQLIASVSGMFISLRLSRMDAALHSALAWIGEFLGVDYGCIALKGPGSGSEGEFTVAYEWDPGRLAEGGGGDPGLTGCAGLVRTVRGYEVFRMESGRGPDGGVTLEGEYLGARGVESVIAVPLISGGDLLGMMGYVSRREARMWTADVTGFLRLLGEILASALTRRGIEDTLRRAREELERRVGERTAELSQINRKLILEIGERKRAEEELTGYRTRLEEIVSQRTGELVEINRRLEREVAERQGLEAGLRRATEAAEAANRAKSEFLANMSHELRTPLNGILGYTQILKRDRGLDGRKRACVEIIHRSGDHLLMLIEDLLELSKIESGRLEIRPGVFLLGKLLEDIADMMRLKAEQKGVKFRVSLSPKLPAAVRSDEKRVRQILLNLIGNAVKFTKRGLVTFLVTPVRGATVRFRVEDTGRGIAEGRLEEIFEAFRRPGATEAEGSGAGLGLSISQRLAQALGGRIEVSSRPGVGSAFWVDLPLEEAGAHLAAGGRGPEPLVTGFQGRRRKILVADDMWENRSIITNLLSPLGFELHDAKDGASAVAKALEVRPDLALVDLIMPGMGGLECVREMRGAEELRGMVIIATSASVFEQTRRESLDAGCDDFLPRPIRAEDLFGILGRTLDLKWVYGDGTATDGLVALRRREVEERGTGRVPAAVLEALGREEVEGLLELARSGDIERIVDWAVELEGRGAGEVAVFAREVRGLAGSFELDRLQAMIQGLLEG